MVLHAPAGGSTDQGVPVVAASAWPIWDPAGCSGQEANPQGAAQRCDADPGGPVGAAPGHVWL